MKKAILIAVLMCSTLAAGAGSTLEKYTACTEWGHAFPVLENGRYVWYQERTCTDYIVDYTTFPPTWITIVHPPERRGGYPPNVE